MGSPVAPQVGCRGAGSAADRLGMAGYSTIRVESRRIPLPVSYVGITEMHDGKFTRSTSYFANPFEAPAWRAPFVGRMDD